MRRLTEDDVTFSIQCRPEEVPVRGNVLASDDPVADKRDEDEIIARLESGDDWAWCAVEVTAHWEDFSASTHLGCCSYASEEDFRQSGDYFDDMKAEALSALNEKIARFDSKLAKLREGA